MQKGTFFFRVYLCICASVFFLPAAMGGYFAGIVVISATPHCLLGASVIVPRNQCGGPPRNIAGFEKKWCDYVSHVCRVFYMLCILFLDIATGRELPKMLPVVKATRMFTTPRAVTTEHAREPARNAGRSESLELGSECLWALNAHKHDENGHPHF